MFPQSYSQVITMLLKILQKSVVLVTLSVAFVMFFVNSTQAVAMSTSFNPNLVLDDETFYGLPKAFWSINSNREESIEKIQTFLESKNSVLAQQMVEISFEPGTWFLDSEYYKDLPEDIDVLKVNPNITLSEYMGKEVSFAELVWLLSRTTAGNSCATTTKNRGVCITEPVNPYFVLAMIQKESSLVYGSCAQPDADESSACRWGPDDFNNLEGRMSRALGYYCFEGAKEDSCYDVNPNWKYYKGLFRQTYFGIRSIRLRAKTCELGGSHAFVGGGGTFYTGSKVWIDGQQLYLGSDFTCANYIYTPHISSNFFNIMKFNFEADKNLLSDIGIEGNYEPVETILF